MQRRVEQCRKTSDLINAQLASISVLPQVAFAVAAGAIGGCPDGLELHVRRPIRPLLRETARDDGGVASALLDGVAEVVLDGGVDVLIRGPSARVPRSCV